MNYFLDFIKQEGFTILSTIFLAITSYIGMQIKKIYESKQIEKEKKAVVRTVVKAVEQMYTELKGQEKYDKAVESIVAMLQEKGISITEIELKMLIEEVVSEFNFPIFEEVAEE